MDVKLIKVFDRMVLPPICAILGLYSKIFPEKLKTGKKKILIIKLWALGDSVISLPMIHCLKKNFPDSKIDVLAHKKNIEVYYANKDINETIEFNLRSVMGLLRKYDLCIDTENYLNISSLISWWSGKYRVGYSHGIRHLLYSKTSKLNLTNHMVQNFLDMIRAIGVNCDAEKLVRLETTKEEKSAVSHFLKENKISKKDLVVGITSGVSETARARIWPVERMAKLADKIIEKYNVKVILIDSPSNKDIVDKIAALMKNKPIIAMGNLKIRQVFSLIERCDFFISNDTGPMHIAAAQGVKTIGIFGPNTPKLWGPYGKGNVAIYHPPKCSPCTDHTTGKLPECFNKNYQECVKNVGVNEVFNAFEKIYNMRK